METVNPIWQTSLYKAYFTSCGKRKAAMCHDFPHFLWLKLETEQFYMLLCDSQKLAFGSQKEHMIKDEKSEK